MSTTFFLGQKYLRAETKKMLGTEISGATTAAPKHFYTLQRSAKIFQFKNTTDVILRIYVSNPEDQDNALIEFVEIDPGETMGVDMFGSMQQFEFPAQTRIYVTGVTLAGVSANPTAGRLRFFSWG